MNWTWVGFSRLVTADDLVPLFRHWFPTCSVEVFDPAAEEYQPADILLLLEHGPAEDFPVRLDLVEFPGPQEAAVEVSHVLARRLAAALDCRTIADGTGYGDDPSPYWSIIWEPTGAAYLADDSGSAFGDGDGGPVRVVRALELPARALDGQGALGPPA